MLKQTKFSFKKNLYDSESKHYMVGVSKMLISKQELQIVSQFRRNARENLTTASRKLRIPVSTLYDRLKKYQGNVILKHTALLNFDKLGYSIRVIMSFKSKSEYKDELQSFLENHHRVNTVYKVSNNSDYLIEVLFKDMIELNNFSETLDKFEISGKHEYYVVKDVKREAFLTNDSAIDIIADE